jgi:LAO/AO transport system kinase
MSFEERVLARMATGIENRDPHALEMLDRLEPGHARIVGITGPPGAGKSTLVAALATAIRRAGKTLAIIAVDPTSHATGGAILGDRIRMQQHYGDPGIFIRSMATRGSLGGLSRATADLARLMDASGKDYVLIETVGVGQAEIAVADVAQVTVVVLVPGMGDDVQAIKAGILEIADIFAINKSDRPGAGRVERELAAMLICSPPSTMLRAMCRAVFCHARAPWPSTSPISMTRSPACNPRAQESKPTPRATSW